MLGPVALIESVTHEAFRRVVIGNPQQRFRQTHQDHTFLAVEAVFLQQGFHPQAGFGIADRIEQVAGVGADLFTAFAFQRVAQQQILNQFFFVAQIMGKDVVA